MTEDRERQEALFRYAVLGDLLHGPLRRGELCRGLDERAAKVWTDPGGKARRFSARTLEEWFYRYRHGGFDALLDAHRKDRGTTRVLTLELQELIVAMKREDPGRSAPLIVEELERAGRIGRRAVSVSTVQRLLRRAGLSGPRLELERPARYRWQACRAGELWQGDALHGPGIFDPASGQKVRVKVFALLDDRSRLIPYLRADFHETQHAFLAVLLGAVLRRGVPRALFLDNHGSFTGSDVAVACAKLQTRLLFARPYDGPAKGKIERFWRTLRARFLDRLDLDQVETLDDLNLRLAAWIEGDYNTRPHSALQGRTPLEVWEDDAEEIRWVDDPSTIESAFTHSITRTARGDATCQIDGRHYEIPTELRGRTVELSYSLLRPGQYWITEGATRIALREVDPEANSRRPRKTTRPGASDVEPTGFQTIEDLLRAITRRKKPDGDKR